MRHIAIQRTSTTLWALSCPYCNYRNIKCPHIFEALRELRDHIEAEHPRIVLQWADQNRAKNQLELAFGKGSECD